MVKRIVSKILLAGTIGLSSMWISAIAGAEQIGVASTVADQLTGTLGAQSGTLHTGDAVFQNQVLVTDGSGSAQFLFIDETVFSIGPNSHVTLDEFVYNASQGTGQVLLNVSQGAFRFITGSAAPESYTVRTPTATIGMRGTIWEGIVDRVLTIVKLIQGKLYICPTQGSTLQGQGLGPRRQNQDGCVLVEEPGTYYVGMDASDAAGGGPGDPDDPDDPNDGIDDLEDPFSPDEIPDDNDYFFGNSITGPNDN
jgi:hypothetical protein